MIAIIGNIELTELLIILMVAVMIFGRNLPRVAAQVVSNVAKARRALQKVWRESGIGDEIRDVQREIDISARRLRDADPRTAFRGASQEIEAAVQAPVTTNAEEATDDPDYGRAEAAAQAEGEAVGGTEGEAQGEADTDPPADEPEAERERRPPWYPDNLYPPSSPESEGETDEDGDGDEDDGPESPSPDPERGQ